MSLHDVFWNVYVRSWRAHWAVWRQDLQSYGIAIGGGSQEKHNVVDMCGKGWRNSRVFIFQQKKQQVPPRSITVRPWKVTFPIGKDRLPAIILQGRAVKLWGCMKLRDGSWLICRHYTAHSEIQYRVICAIGSINSHYFHIIGDGHQPKSVGVFRAPLYPITRIPY